MSTGQQCFSYVGRVFLYVYICRINVSGSRTQYAVPLVRPATPQSQVKHSCISICLYCSSIFLVHIYLQCCRGVGAAAPIIYKLLKPNFIQRLVRIKSVVVPQFIIYNNLFYFSESQGVPGCNNIANLSLKIVFWTHKFAVGTH